MKRHLRLYAAFWRNCLRQAVEFRVNFWINLVTNISWMAILIVFLAIIYHNTTKVAGWTEPQMFLLFGAYSLVRGVSNMLFYSNLSQLPTFIRMGTMDFILTKPVNSQFYVSLRYVSLDDLGQSFAALFIIAYGWQQLHRGLPSAGAMAGFVVLLVCSLALFYSLTLLLMTLSFWLVRLDNLMVLSDTLFQVARTPIDIFRSLGAAPRILLTYVFPLAFLAAMPVNVLLQRPGLPGLVPIGLLLALAFLSASALLWKIATRAYSSASS